MPVLPFHFPVPLFKIIPLQEKIHPGLTATENRRALSRYRRIGTIIDGPHKKFAPPGGFFRTGSLSRRIIQTFGNIELFWKRTCFGARFSGLEGVLAFFLKN
jgi:hypothetical protein